MLADYHIHCEFSDDSVALMEEQIEQGIKLGLDEMCFTDHVDYGIKKDWDEGDIVWRDPDPMGGGEAMPIANVDYPKYFEKLHAMKETYKDRMVVKQGLEFGIQTITIDQYETLYQRYEDELDFVLLSMHQVDNKEFWTQDFQYGKTQKDYNEQYYQEILNVMRVFKHYSVLAHLDLIIRYDEQGVYPFENVKPIIMEILKLAIKDGKGIELNTSSWRYGLSDTQPSRAILKLYYDLGGRIITVGSDAHTPEQLGAHLEDAYAILKDIGFTEVCTFDHMQPIFHKI